MDWLGHPLAIAGIMLFVHRCYMGWDWTWSIAVLALLHTPMIIAVAHSFDFFFETERINVTQWWLYQTAILFVLSTALVYHRLYVYPYRLQ